jgi:peptide deformylase
MDKKIFEIVTLPHPCLTTKAQSISHNLEGLAEAEKIIEQLEESLKPRLPAAGLAAPQIALSKRVFIFSWDRALDHLEAVINPSFEPLDFEMSLGWEGCFSVPLALAQVSRFQNIRVTYLNREGRHVSYILRGFAARVFQHEYDHLEGIENIHKEGATIKQFASQDELVAFITEVKKGDVAHYIKPERVDEVTDPSLHLC